MSEHDLTAALQRNLSTFVFSFGLQIVGLAILSQAFPVLASRVWTWLTSLSVIQILLGIAGYWMFNLGKDYGREQLLKDPDIPKGMSGGSSK